MTTCVPGRRAFRTQLELDFARADRYNRPPPGWS